MKTASRRSTLAALLVLAALVGPPRDGRALVGDRMERFGLDGSFRTMTVATRNSWQTRGQPYNGGDGISQLNLRLVAGGEPLPWLKFEVHGVQALSVQPPGLLSSEGGGGAMIGAGAAGSGWRMHPLDLDWGETRGDVRARLSLDRCEVRIRTDRADVAIGRQAISFGKAWFWNPLDVFAAFAPLQLDRDYKPGVDALRVDVPIGEMSGLTLVAAMGDLAAEAPLDQLGVVGRVTTTLRGFDVALQGGRVGSAWQAGAAVAGELEPVEVRAEVSFVRPDQTAASSLQDSHGTPTVGQHLAGVVGVSRRFENTLYLSGELLVHTGGPEDLTSRLALAGNRALLQASRQVVGLMASYELVAVMTGSLAVLASLEQPSALLQPGLTWSAADEVDVMLGGMISLGERPAMVHVFGDLWLPDPRSELGTYPHMFWARVVAHF